VIGIDSFTPFYAVELKRDRASELAKHKGFRMIEADLVDRDSFTTALAGAGVTHVLHVAAQPSVRYSITHPDTYASANLTAFLNMLEYCRHTGSIEHMVYASSSSVYGGNTTLPFRESDAVDHPISLYAATKRANELMAYSYAHLYRLKLTGLRFFTVYGPWGRPDMAVWKFAEAILAGRPIEVFNHGRMRRDFTYIDDIVTGTLAALDAPPSDRDSVPHRLYNIGNHRAEELMHLIALLEESLGRKADCKFLPMQPGDVPETFADIDAIRRDHGFEPRTPLDVGIPNFARWFLGRYGA
jgi:UDP-glucuronate 4-epimerase